MGLLVLVLVLSLVVQRNEHRQRSLFDLALRATLVLLPALRPVCATSSSRVSGKHADGPVKHSRARGPLIHRLCQATLPSERAKAQEKGCHVARVEYGERWGSAARACGAQKRNLSGGRGTVT